MVEFANYFKQAIRRLTASPGFTAIALLTIAAGIGANSTIFGIVNGVLWKPLPYPDPDRLIAIWHTALGLGIKDLDASPSTYLVYREQNRTFTDVALWNAGSVSVTGLAEPEQVQEVDVTEATLPLLGAKPLIGRGFSGRDVQADRPLTVVLSFAYWQRKFGGQRSVLGRRILIDGKAHEVIGVLPPAFRFLDKKPALLLPLQFDRSKLHQGNFSFRAIARLRPGITIAAASADVARMIPIVSRTFPVPEGFTQQMFDQARLGPNLRPLARDVVGDIAPTLAILMGTIGLVLLIACANVANLLLVRVEGRQQELAIRKALGASGWQVAGEILAESLLLGLGGGLIGLALAFGSLRVLVAVAPKNLPRLEDIGLDGNVALFTLLISVAAGLLFGCVPVVRQFRDGVALALRQGGRNASSSRTRHRARKSLVVVQITLALVLLVSSGLMIRTALALLQVDPGFTDPSTIQTLQISIPRAQAEEPERAARMSQDLAHALNNTPGARSAAFASEFPMSGSENFDPVFARDRTYSPRDLPLHRYVFVAPGYFGTIGTRMIAGRDFEWSDLYNKGRVAIVSEKLAREYWRDPKSAIGKQVRESMTGQWRQVIGVVANMHFDGMNQPAPTAIYWPTMLDHFRGDDLYTQRELTFVVRSNRSGSQAFIEQLRQSVWSVNPNLPVANTRTALAMCQTSLARTSLTLVLLSIAAGMALLLGVVGIYGVIAYSVSQRTREIGVRVAIGAQPGQVMQLFLQEGLLLTGVGLFLGLTISSAAMRWMSSVLFGVRSFDPLTYTAVSVVLASAALAATYLPARKALQVDPSNALRAD